MTHTKRLALALLGALALAAGVAAPQDAHAIGLLIPKDTSVRPFDVQSHRVDVTITNTAAATKITQVFKNHTDRPLEATFVFPIPEGATVSDFNLWINGKKTPGAVLEKNEARRIYESIVRRVEDPGLIEYIDGRMFRASIFPIPAGGTQKLEIKFAQVLEKRAGMYRYVYPLAVGTDYVTAKTAQDFTLTARVLSPIPITTAYSPTHKISTFRKATNQLVLGTEEMYAELDRDFELFIGLSKKEIGLNVMTHDPDGEGGEPGYFMMALAPRVDVAAHEEIGQTFTFVMDTSGSMAGDKIEQARKTLAFCLQRLKPQDHFNIVRFSTDVEPLFDKPVPATVANVSEALSFSRDLQPAGGTAIQPALEAALGQAVTADQPHQVIFVTDGIPTVGETDPARIVSLVSAKAQGDQTRLFTFGLGFDVNTSLLDGMAAQSNGRSDYVKPAEDLEAAVSALYTRISSPVLTGIGIDFGGARAYDVYPKRIPALFRGDQVLLFGRYRGAFDEVKVTGKAGPEAKEYVFGGGSSDDSARAKKRVDGAPSTEFSEPLEFLPKLWATRKVGYLLEQIRLNGEIPELKTEVIRLAKKFGLVTPYTSYLAVDDSEFDNRPQPRPGLARRGDLGGEEPMPAEEDEAGLDALDSTTRGGGSGFGKAATKKAAPPADAPARPRRTRNRQAKLEARAKADAFKDFDGEVGEGAVAAAEATRDYKEREKVGGERTGRTYVAGRTFVLTSGVWVQDGVAAKKGAKTIKVEEHSTRYFELLRKHRDLRKVLGLGDRVIVEIDGRVYEFVPASK